jgi:hypothetical protein
VLCGEILSGWISRKKERGVLMAIVPQQQGLPFVVEPVSPQQVQLWASYAGQVSTQEGFNLMVAVFNGFWWQTAAADSYQSAVSLLGYAGYASSVVFYLDMIVNELRTVMEVWASVVRFMDEYQGLRPASGQWIEDAMQQIQKAMELRQVAASQVAIWCDAYHLALPEDTQAFFAEMQAKAL